MARLSVNVDDWERDELQAIAKEAGCVYGGNGSISALMRAIANGDVQVIGRTEGLPTRVNKLEARILKLEQGHKVL